ncbi:MAG: phosphotransacetylase family protein [Dehalococcoidales bacterium]|nr:phosphotransacetylase family protein [Dehalococcoidales bacterium]
MAALYITSSQAGAGKTLVCAGLGKHLKGDGKKVGFFKPMVADIKSPPKKATDSDTAFIKRILSLKEPIDSLCPVIGGEGKLTSEVKQAYAKVSKGKDVVIVEGIWRQRPGAKPIEASYEIVEALKAKVVVVEGYSPELSKAKFIDKYRDFGERLLGIVVNKVPRSQVEPLYEQLSSQLGGVDILGVLPEDRVLLGLTIGELAECIEGKILNCAEKSAELVENFMLGAMTVDHGPDYFGRKANKAVVIKAERPDMQLAALETSTKCLVLSGDVSPIHTVRRSAEDKGIPIIVTNGDTVSVVNSVEQALGETKFNHERKLPRLAEIMEQQFDFQALYKGLGLAA